jgi:predicted nucleotidyltransferase
METNEYIKELLKQARDLIMAKYGEDLVSIAVFGSVARGDFNSQSDIDMVIVANSEESMGRRLNKFGLVLEELLRTSAYNSCKMRMMPHKILPIILTPAEVKARPSILLDLVTDARIIFDKDDFLKLEIEALHSRLKEIGAKKLEHNGKWYWILKPGIRRGEVIEV